MHVRIIGVVYLWKVMSINDGKNDILICPYATFLVEIGDIAGVADVTIRQSYRLMYIKADELFPTDFKFHTTIDKLPTSWEQVHLSPDAC